MGYKVERKYTDFVELRDFLKKMYPGYIVPALPKSPPKKLSTEILSKYKERLQKFLDEILRHPLLRTNEIFTKFISEKDAKIYEEFKLNLDKKLQSPIKEVSQCITLEGTANIEIDPIIESECSENLTNSKKIKSDLQKLDILNDELMINIQNTSNTLSQISQIHANIAESFSSAGAAGMFEQFVALGDVFGKISEMCKQIQGVYSLNFDKFYKDYTKQFNATDELLREWSQFLQYYQKLEKRLADKKEELFLKKQLDTWELKEDCQYPVEMLKKNKEIAISQMLPNETNEVLKTKELYGYLCNKVPEEFKRVWANNEKDFREHFSGVAQMCSGLFDRIKFLWSDLAVYLDTLIKGKDLMNKTPGNSTPDGNNIGPVIAKI